MDNGVQYGYGTPINNKNMPTKRARRRNKAAASTNLPSDAVSPEGHSSSDGLDYPMTSRMITEANLLDGTFNLPGSSPDNSDESSDGWSDSAGLTSEDEEVAIDVNGSQDIESTMIESTGDGLLLVSDDEMGVGNDEYLSDSALSLNAFKRPSLQSHDEANPDSTGAEHPEQSKIPSCVALGDLPHEHQEIDNQGIDDPSRNYDARYDGSLQDLMQSADMSGPVEIDCDHGDDDDDDDSDDSSGEMAGYLSTASAGEMRGIDLLLKPYVGERPPTPPSPSRSPKPKTHKKEPRSPPSMFHSPSPFQPPSVPMMEEDAGPYDQYHHSAREEEYEQQQQHADYYFDAQEDYERGVPYGNQDGYVSPDGAQSPALSGVTHEDETATATVTKLTRARRRDRRLILVLTCGLGCALLSLAAVVGGVIAVTLFQKDDAIAATSAPAASLLVPSPPTVVQASAPVMTSPLVIPAAPASATRPMLAPISPPLATVAPTGEATKTPVASPVASPMASPVAAPASATPPPTLAPITLSPTKSTSATVTTNAPSPLPSISLVEISSAPTIKSVTLLNPT